MSLKKDKQTNPPAPPQKSPTNSSVSMTLREVSQEKSRWLTWNSAFLILITFEMLRKQLTTMAEINVNNKYNHNQTDKATHWDQWLEQLQQQPKLISLCLCIAPIWRAGAHHFFHPRHYRPPQAPWPGREESCKTRRGSAARCCVRYARRVKEMIRRFSGWAAISPSSATAGAITEMDERRSGRHRRGWRFRGRGCENAAFSTRNNELWTFGNVVLHSLSVMRE